MTNKISGILKKKFRNKKWKLQEKELKCLSNNEMEKEYDELMGS